jgi:hypothetical protein
VHSTYFILNKRLHINIFSLPNYTNISMCKLFFLNVYSKTVFKFRTAETERNSATQWIHPYVVAECCVRIITTYTASSFRVEVTVIRMRFGYTFRLKGRCLLWSMGGGREDAVWTGLQYHTVSQLRRPQSKFIYCHLAEVSQLKLCVGIISQILSKLQNFRSTL